MSEWPEIPVTDLYDISSGLSKPRSEFGFGHEFVTFKDVLDNYFLPDELGSLVNTSEKEQDKCSIKRGDVFLTRTSETQEDLGMSAIALRDYKGATFNGFTKRLRPKPETDIVPEYAAYYFRGPNFRQQVTAMSTLSTRASLNNSMIERLTFSMPPRPVQDAISQILKALDDKIELNQRMNATLESMARAIFKSWFVDFDPVKINAGQMPAGSQDAEVLELFPSAFQDSELGRIPAGWSLKPLYETAQYVNGAAFKGKDFCDRSIGLPVVKIAELKNGISSQTKFSERELDETRTIDTGDLLYSWSGSPETSLDAFVWAGGKGLLNQHIFKVISETKAQKHFVYYLLKELRDTLVGIARDKQTTGLGHVTVADMRRLQVCVPPDDVLTECDVTLGRIFDTCFSNELEAIKLAAIRDTLIPKLLSGELSVFEALTATEEVLVNG